MKRRRIGSLEVSVVGLGGNSFGTDFFGARCDQREVTRIINAALDAGVNLIDTAEEYSITSFLGEGHSEELIGVALGSRRDEAVIATKFLNTSDGEPDQRGASRIVAAAEASLLRLRTDRIDLYQQHQPDPDTPIEETLKALEQLVLDGKVREVGCCNFTADMLDAATEAAGRSSFAAFRSCQVQYSLLERPPNDVLASVERNRMSILAYFPLASGLLTGKYRRGEPPPPDSRLAADGLVRLRCGRGDRGPGGIGTRKEGHERHRVHPGHTPGAPVHDVRRRQPPVREPRRPDEVPAR
jgi:aryl-alcohol dehydrogenase-like predicted oxidoreductase